MSAFDRLQNYSSRGTNSREVSTIFDISKPQGCFLDRVHKQGYKMYEVLYKRKGSEGDTISASEFNALSEQDKVNYESDIVYTELYNVITAPSNQKIDAAAGSGKTTSLIFKIMHDIVTGESMRLQSVPSGMTVRVVNKVWVCTFLRTGALDLEKSLSYWQRKLGYSQTSNQVVFSTLDAEFKRCLNAMGVETNIGDASKLHSLFCKAVDSCGITRNGYKLTKEDYQILSSIVSYYRGRLDEKRYQHPSCADYDLKPTILDLLVKQFASLRQANKVMDFDEIQELLYKYLYITPNKAVQDFVADRYNFIYVDEFQDTSQMQYAILKFYARGNLWINRSGGDVKVESNGGTVPDGLYTAEETLGKIVAIGDVSQCLIGGTSVDTENGIKAIEEISVGDRVRSCQGRGKLGYEEVSNISERMYRGTIIELKTSCGYTISCTPEHKFFTGRRDNSKDSISTVLCCNNEGDHGVVYASSSNYSLFDTPEIMDEFAKNTIRNNSIDVCYERALFLWTPIQFNLSDGYINYASLVVCASDLKLGDKILVVNERGSVSYDTITSLEYKDYSGKVYDVTVPRTRNFIANSIVSHNCIYSFKGSDSKILSELFDADFRPVNSALSVNWRCPENILNPVIPSIHKNYDSANQRIEASNKGGEFHAYGFNSYKQMIEKLKEDVQNDMENNRTVAILCRTNFDGMIPAFALEAHSKFDFSISGDNMTMNSPLPKKILGVSRLFTDRCSPNVKNSLSYFVRRGGEFQVKQLMDALKANNLSIWQIPESDLGYSAPDLLPFVKEVKKIMMPDGKRVKEKEVEALKFVYSYLKVNSFGGDSAYCESARAYIEIILYVLDTNNFSSVHEFIEEMDFINDKLQGRVKRNAPIQIATVHEFKGKERDSIYVWNDSQGVFPSSKCDIEDEEQLNEERRVHYIACTRAKEKECIYTLNNRVGIFVKEMDLNIENPTTIKATLMKG